MSVRIIETASEGVLYRRYSGQTNPQDCYIELDLREGTLLADYNAEIGNAVPFTVFHGFERRYEIPVLTGSAADDLMQKIAPLADRILVDWESDWDGNNKVAILGEDARAAEEEILSILGLDGPFSDEAFDPSDMVTVWDVDGACNGVTADTFDITANTTDEQLDGIEEEIRQSLAEVSPSPVILLDGVGEYLRGLRDDLLDEDED